MSYRRTGFSAKQSRRRTRQMDNSTIGTHVTRGSHARRSVNASSVSFADNSRTSRSQVQGITPYATSGEGQAAYRRRSQQRRYNEGVQRRANFRRIGTVIIVIAVIAAIAIGAGYLAFRGTVGSGVALKNSNAGEALVQVKSTEPYYTLITADLGAVAEPLEQAGPDVILLARIDRQAHTLSLVNIPASLQITVDTATRRLGDIALEGDAALISAVSTFAKVDITHFVKVDEEGLRAMVDGLGGVEINVDQLIDDPHAGSRYIPAGTATLDAESAITYLRATNLTLGVTDQFAHQTYFAAVLLEDLLGGQGNLASKLDSMGSCFQTDYSLGEIEELAGWIKDLGIDGITRITLPGYMTAVTGVVDTGDSLYIAKADDMAKIIEALENGTTPSFADTAEIVAASPASFTIEVQNGTDIVGAATKTSDLLTAAGFKVEESGNAEQQVYDETLVVYKDGQTGPSQAKAVIDTLGVGRAVDGAAYYEFDTDILVVIGYDYKPVS